MALSIEAQMQYLHDNEEVYRCRVDMIDALEKEINAIVDDSYEEQYHQIMENVTETLNGLNTYDIEFTVEFVLHFYQQMKLQFCIIQHGLATEELKQASMDPKDWFLYKDFRKLKYVL